MVEQRILRRVAAVVASVLLALGAAAAGAPQLATMPYLTCMVWHSNTTAVAIG